MVQIILLSLLAFFSIYDELAAQVIGTKPVLVGAIAGLIMGGFRVTGGILPAVGLAILSRFLPLKKLTAPLLIEFVSSAYLNLPILGTALIGLAMSMVYYQIKISNLLKSKRSSEENLSNSLMEVGEYED